MKRENGVLYMTSLLRFIDGQFPQRNQKEGLRWFQNGNVDWSFRLMKRLDDIRVEVADSDSKSLYLPRVEEPAYAFLHRLSSENRPLSVAVLGHMEEDTAFAIQRQVETFEDHKIIRLKGVDPFGLKVYELDRQVSGQFFVESQRVYS